MERELPDDPGLPGLVAIRSFGLRRVLPELDLGSVPIELEVCAYKDARRITQPVLGWQKPIRHCSPAMQSASVSHAGGGTL